MDEKQFAARLTNLRINADVSARDMSLSIGQNAGYINNIETGKSLPSMSSFFYICEYLHITPSEFFDITTENPDKIKDLTSKLKKLNSTQLNIISLLIDEFFLNRQKNKSP